MCQRVVHHFSEIFRMQSQTQLNVLKAVHFKSFINQMPMQDKYKLGKLYKMILAQLSVMYVRICELQFMYQQHVFKLMHWLVQ